MSVEENKAFVRRYYEHGFEEAMRGNLDVLHEYFADNHHDHSRLHEERSGVNVVKEILADASQATPDTEVEIVHMAAEGDLVFVHWQATGTHERQHQTVQHARNVPPTGDEATVSGISLFRIEGGKFVERWIYHNFFEYAHERGMGAAPSGSSGTEA